MEAGDSQVSGIDSDKLAAFQALIRGGKSLKEAKRLLATLGTPAAQIEAIAKAHGIQTKRIILMREPLTISVPGKEAWYAGPSEDDTFWPSLRTYLLKTKGWDEDVVDSVDRSSTKVVAHLDHPGDPKIATRGLVVGYVQSGKTANFTAVIAKAADVNYRLFIVFAGIHNSLRSQTQRRLEAELRELNSEHWHCLTTVEEDFRGRLDPNAFLTKHATQKVLCVVKKNTKVLDRLSKWLKKAKPGIISNCPTLVIDDEADQAGINVAKESEDRSTTNRLINEILERLPKGAYVGYTATPFANVLIDPADRDIYPKDFISSLPRPKDYFGPETIFGRERLHRDETDEDVDGLNMVRCVEVAELAKLKPPSRNARTTFEPEIVESLDRALNYFWMATSARVARGQTDKHSTMLVHTTLYTDVHRRIVLLLDSQRRRLLAAIEAGDEATLANLETLWDEECDAVPAKSLGLKKTSFKALSLHLIATLERGKVLEDNNNSLSRLDYAKEKGQVVVVVGGNTLSRGLTLEGLVVSYFIRAASAYDTLLQMGRWFGYRPGYQDLPRVWMTNDLKNDFFDLATVEKEIRVDIERYELEHKTPTELGVRIRTHPTLAITSALKMGAATSCDVSFAATRPSTIRFRHKDADWLKENLEAARSLLKRCGNPNPGGKDGVWLFRGVGAEAVQAFIASYHFHERKDGGPKVWNAYIKAQRERGHLNTWNVAVLGHGGKGAETLNLGLNSEVGLIVRSQLTSSEPDVADIKAVMSKQDLLVDLDDNQRRDLSKLGTSEVLKARPKGTGLLLLYPIHKVSEPIRKTKQGKRPVRKALNAEEHVIAAALVFPESDVPTPQQYKTVDLSRVVRESEDWAEEEGWRE